tara:strand:- start:5420 stop:5920 length:501 start_codon:yes stop_codon:yes gene_type:complete
MIQNFGEVRTAEERQWADQLRRRSTTGTMNLDYLNQVAGRTASQVGALQKAQIQGGMMQQGLGNSIVAQELARKTDRDTLTSLADESRNLAMMNEQTKIQAQDMLGQYGQMRSQRLQNIRNQQNQMTQNRWSQLSAQSHDMTMNPFSWMNASQKIDHMYVGHKGRI